MAGKKCTTAFTYMFAVVIILITILSLSSINASAVTINLSINKSVINKGTEITATATGSGGSGYQYSFAVKTPSGGNYVTLKSYSSSNTFKYTPNETGTYFVRASLSSTGNSPVSTDISFTVFDLVNNSNISTTTTTVDSSISVNASASGGSGDYSYKYTYTPPNDSNKYFVTGDNTTPFISSSSVSFTPSQTGTYKIFVTIRDKTTNVEKMKEFSLQVKTKTYTALTNTSTINKTEFYMNETLVVQGSATGGSGNYEYKFEMLDLNSNMITGATQNYSSNSVYKKTLTSIVDSYIMLVTVKDTTTNTTSSKKITFEIKDKEYPNLTLNTTINTTTINTPNDVIGNDKLRITASASGGSGGYTYEFHYKKDDGEEKIFGSDTRISEDFGATGESSTFECQLKQSGNYQVIVYVYDSRNVMVRRVHNIKVNKSPEHNKDQLSDYVTNVVEYWYNNLTPSQVQIFISLNEVNSNSSFDYHKWKNALTEAKKVINQGSEYDVDAAYEELEKQHNLALEQSIVASEASTVLFSVSSSMSTFLNWLLKGIGGLLTQDFGTQDSSSTFQGFDIQTFVDDYSPIFMIFANALLILLFGVNVLSTAIQYELFTLRGVVKTIAHLFFAKVWIDLSCRICLMIIGIAREMLLQIMNKAQDILDNIDFSFAFTYNSGIWLVGPVIDFLVMLLIMVVIFLLFIPLLYFLIKVIIKLFIMNFEFAALTAMSPVFFACLVGEETKQYFKNFFMTFLSVLVELIFMGIVYAAFISWYKSFGDLSTYMDLSQFDIGTQITNLAIFGIVFIAACHLMIKPPEVFKNLLK